MVTVNIPAAIDQIVTHCAAAGAALTVPIKDVARAEPLPSDRCIRVWWKGETVPPGMPEKRVMNGELVGEIVEIDAFWPISSQGTTITNVRDKEVWLLATDIRTRLQGDSDLGGNVWDIDVQYATAEFALFGATLYRHLQFDVHLTYVEYPRTP